MTRTLAAVLVAGLVLMTGGVGHRLSAAEPGWRQWGGPTRNFVAPAGRLATSWPAGGPRRLWQRALGEGHSAVLVEDGRLYTMYRPLGALSLVRRTQQEVITALDAGTGATLWEYAYDSSTSGLDLSQGSGPHSTPLIVGNVLIASSSRVEIFALDKATGRLLWTHNLPKELGAPIDGRAYAPSPIAYRNTVIVPAGASGAAVVAFDLKTGAIAWKAGTFAIGPGSPLLITVDGQDQLVVSGANEMLGVDPTTGSVLWRHPHRTDYGLNISTPVWGEGNLLFVSAAYNNGARGLKLSQAGGKTTVQELWYQNRMRVHMGTVIRIGDFAVGSSGDFGPCPTAAIDLATGRILWQSRDFARASFIQADDKLVIMDEDGTLGLATATRTGLQVLARASILTGRTWTVPTLVGTRLYARDRKNIAAFELGA